MNGAVYSENYLNPNSPSFVPGARRCLSYEQTSAQSEIHQNNLEQPRLYSQTMPQLPIQYQQAFQPFYYYQPQAYPIQYPHMMQMYMHYQYQPYESAPIVGNQIAGYSGPAYNNGSYYGFDHSSTNMSYNLPYTYLPEDCHHKEPRKNYSNNNNNYRRYNNNNRRINSSYNTRY